MVDIVQNLVDSTACAALPCGNQPDAVVAAALANGLLAATHGCRIPLPVLLDVQATFSAARLSYHLREPAEGRTQTTNDYDNWLVQFCGLALRVTCPPQYGDRRGASPCPHTLGTAQAGLGPSSFLPMLMAESPVVDCRLQGTAWQWARAYDTMLSGNQTSPAPAIGSIRQIWSAPRRADAGLWGWWPGGAGGHEPPPSLRPTNGDPPPRRPGSGDPTLPAARPAAMWSVFTDDARMVHETFDHPAAWYYHEADDLELSDEQRSYIRRLKLCSEYVCSPLTTSYEELNPHSGMFTISTLSFGKYGEFLIANNRDIRLNNPPSDRPPSPIRIHLAWLAGCAGALCSRAIHHCSTRQRIADPSPAGQPCIEVSDAAALKAFAALLLDDWRSFLIGLPVTFHIHRGFPALESAALGRAGAPRRRAFIGSRGLWPRALVRNLFRRESFTELAARELAWHAPADGHASRSDWWCGCVSAADLDDLGLKHLPSRLDHLIVLNPAGEAASGYEVQRYNGSAELTEAWSSQPNKPGDPSLLETRSRAFDVLLLNLMQRMPQASPSAYQE